MCNRAVLDCTPKRRWIASGEQAPIMQMTCRWSITSNLADWAAASLGDVWVRTLPRPDVRYFGHAGCPGADYHRASADLLRRVVTGGWRTIARWFGDRYAAVTGCLVHAVSSRPKCPTLPGRALRGRGTAPGRGSRRRSVSPCLPVRCVRIRAILRERTRPRDIPGSWPAAANSIPRTAVEAAQQHGTEQRRVGASVRACCFSWTTRVYGGGEELAGSWSKSASTR